MKRLLSRSLVAASLALALPSVALAEDDDGARFRGGVALQGGLMAIPAMETNLGAVGVSGEIGVQINNLVGLYWVPHFDVLFGSAGGVNLVSALMVDFTFVDDLLTVGVGPDIGLFAAIGVDTTNASASALGGANYGGRLRFQVHPVVGDGEDGIRRKAFSIGLDTRLMGGPVAGATVGPGEASGEVTGFYVQPMLTIGYTAF
jgi:hypothetical protein